MLMISIRQRHRKPLSRYYYWTDQCASSVCDGQMLLLVALWCNSAPSVWKNIQIVSHGGKSNDEHKHNVWCSYNSVVSSGREVGTLDKLFSRQSTMPSEQRHGWGHKLRPPHSIGAFSVKPVERRWLEFPANYFKVLVCFKSLDSST